MLGATPFPQMASSCPNNILVPISQVSEEAIVLIPLKLIVFGLGVQWAALLLLMAISCVQSYRECCQSISDTAHWTPKPTIS